MWQLEVFILKLLAVDGFATSAIVVCEVTPLTHLMAAVKALRKYGGTLHITQQVKYTLLSFTHTLSQTHMYWYLHTFSLKHTYTQIHAHPPTHTHSLSLSQTNKPIHICMWHTNTLSQVSFWKLTSSKLHRVTSEWMAHSKFFHNQFQLQVTKPQAKGWTTTPDTVSSKRNSLFLKHVCMHIHTCIPSHRCPESWITATENW